MKQKMQLLGNEFRPMLFQRQFAGRVLCVAVAVPLMALLFTPLLYQAAQIWRE